MDFAADAVLDVMGPTQRPTHAHALSADAGPSFEDHLEAATQESQGLPTHPQQAAQANNAGGERHTGGSPVADPTPLPAQSQHAPQSASPMLAQLAAEQPRSAQPAMSQPAQTPAATTPVEAPRSHAARPTPIAASAKSAPLQMLGAAADTSARPPMFGSAADTSARTAPTNAATAPLTPSPTEAARPAPTIANTPTKAAIAQDAISAAAVEHNASASRTMPTGSRQTAASRPAPHDAPTQMTTTPVPHAPARATSPDAHLGPHNPVPPPATAQAAPPPAAPQSAQQFKSMQSKEVEAAHALSGRRTPSSSTPVQPNPTRATGAASMTGKEPSILASTDSAETTHQPISQASAALAPTQAPHSHAVHAAAHALLAAQQVAREIVRRFEGGATRFEVRLDPPELGRVEVRLDVSRDHRVSAVIAADSPEALTELARHARELEQMLQGAGLELREGGLSFDLRQREEGTGRDGFDAISDQAVESTEEMAPVVARPLGYERWRGLRVDMTV